MCVCVRASIWLKIEEEKNGPVGEYERIFRNGERPFKKKKKIK